MKLLIETGDGAVGVEGGVIVAPAGDFDIVLQVRDGRLHPGLINAHDHLHRNHYGRLGHPPYANAYEWGHDIHDRDRDRIAAGRAMARRDALLVGAWKSLRAGVTTVVHHDAWEPEFDAGFPLRVARIHNAHSLGFESSLPNPPIDRPFAIHLAEGRDTRSADEVRELGERGLLDARTLAVHMCGADAEGVARFRRSGAAVVWCPTSNEFLFECAVPAELLEPGVDVLLGSDSLLTGAGSLLDELCYARSLGLISDERLLDAVGVVSAQRLGVAPPSLEPGARADLVVLRRPLLEASDADVALVISGGELRVLDPSLVPVLGTFRHRGRVVERQGVVRWESGYSSLGRRGEAPRVSLPASSLVMR